MPDPTKEPAAPNPQPDNPPQTPAPPAKPGKPAETPPAGPTEDQRKAIERDAVEAYKRQQAAADQRRKDEADREAAAARGEFDKVKSDLERERDGAKLELRRERMLNRLTARLLKDHPAYAPLADEIALGVAVDADTTDETMDKRIGERVADYVKKVQLAKPAEGRATGAAPAGPAGGVRVPHQRDKQRAQASVGIASSRF